MLVTLVVIKLDKSKLSNNKQSANIEFIFSTLIDLNSLNNSIEVNLLQPLNKYSIFVAELILNSDKFKYSKDVQLLNILLISVIFFPSNSLLKFIEVKLVQY